MHKEYREFITVGDLKRFLADLPDDMRICRSTNGHYRINKIGDVGGFVGTLPIGYEEVPEVVLQLSA